MNKFASKTAKIVYVCLIFISLTGLYIWGYSSGKFTSNIYMYNQQMKDIKMAGEITSNHVIKQQIIIPENYSGNFIDFNIFFATYQRVNSSNLIIKLTQGDIEEQITLNSSGLKDNSYAPIRFKEQRFRPGEADLTITSDTLDKNQAVTAVFTRDISQGQVSLDNQEQSNYGLLHQEIYPVRNLNWLYLALFLLFFGLAILQIFNVSFSRINYYFCMSIVGGAALVIYSYPSVTVAAEIYAEAASNYFAAAYEKGWIDNLKQLDAGYLPLLPRIISLIFVKIFHIGSSFAIITQWVALLSLGIFSALFTLKTFRELIPSDLLRFIVAFSITAGMFHDYELFTFINFSYLAVLPCLLIMFYDLQKIKRWKMVFICIVGFLLVSSKAYFIAFLPFYGCLFLYYVLKKKVKSAIFYGFTSISMLIQVIVVISNRSTWTSQSAGTNVDTSLGHMLFQLISLYVRSVYWFFLKTADSMSSDFGKVIVIIIAILITFAMVYFVKKNGSKRLFLFILVTQLLAIMSLTLSLTVPYVKGMDVWAVGFEIPYNRHFIFSNILIFMGVLIAFVRTFKTKHMQVIMGLVFMFIYIINGYKGQDFYPYENQSYSQWKENFAYFEQGGCEPANPDPWIICKQGTVHYDAITVNQEKPIFEVDLKSLNEESEKWQSTGLIMNKTSPLNQKLKIVLYGENSEKLGAYDELSNPTYKYGYFMFDRPLKIKRVEFYTQQNEAVSITNPTLTFFGKPIQVK